MKFTQAKALIAAGDITKFYRSPQCMETYDNFRATLKDKGIDMTTRLLVEELRWVPESTPITTPADEVIPLIKCADIRPFANVKDTTILPNSFPYYLEDGVVHLCVWVRSPLPPDPLSEVGDISAYNRHLVDRYIKQTFTKQLDLSEDRILWFKNWAALQSVRALPHIHVILDHPDASMVKSLLGTGGLPIRYEPKL